MNKLLLLFLLSIMILFAQCAGDCQGKTIDTETNDTPQKKADFCKEQSTSTKSKECVPNNAGTACQENALPCSTAIPSDIAEDAKASFCEGLSAAENKKCQLKSDKSACEPVDKPATNSGSILNAFKITLTLIIIFTIL